MAKRLLENLAAEKEADRIGAQFAGSNDVMGDMGKTFNFDFSNVNLHGGSEGASMAASHGDLAYAQGNNAYFGADILNQHTPEANMAVGHELTHVMQQNDGAGVSEHVPFGESQGLGFFGKIKRFFRNLFGGKKKKKDQAPSQEATQPTVTQSVEQTVPAPAPEPTVSPEEQQEREELLETLRSLGVAISRKDKNGPIEDLRQKVRQQQINKGINEGDLGSVVEMSEEDMGTDSQLDKADLATISKIRNSNWQNEKSKQEMDAEGGTDIYDLVNINETDPTKMGRAFAQGFATSEAEKLVKTSEGYKIATMLIEKTPLYKKLASTIYDNKLESSGILSRLFRQIRPVYINDKGTFLSNNDKENHQWNIDYLKSITVNPKDTGFVDSYLDEILGMERYVSGFIFGGEDFVSINPEMAYRMEQYGMTFDWFAKTKVFKDYLTANHDGIYPGDYKRNWCLKAQAADILTKIMANLCGVFLDNFKAKNGVGGQTAVDLHYKHSSNEKDSKHGIYATEDVKKEAYELMDRYRFIRDKYKEEEGGKINHSEADIYKHKGYSF